MSTREAELMSWPDYQQALADDAVVILPVGAHEQHGPHLPMATDAIFARHIALQVAEQINGIVLPTLHYGYKSQARSGGGQTFTGTISLDGATLTSQVLDILREVARHGARNCLVINGHYENQWFLTEGIELAQRELQLQQQQMKVVRTEYWDFTPEPVYQQIFLDGFPGVDLEHAALIETSMMLYIHPELVNQALIPNHPMANFPPHDRYPQDSHGVPPTGVLAPAGNASADKGKLLLDATIERLVQAMRVEFNH